MSKVIDYVSTHMPFISVKDMVYFGLEIVNKKVGVLQGAHPLSHMPCASLFKCDGMFTLGVSSHFWCVGHLREHMLVPH
jgi:hypothetical protein